MTSVRERYAWWDRAACRDDLGWVSRSDWQTQLKICGRCPVRRLCLASALELGTDGVQGGTTPVQRLSWYRRHHLQLDLYVQMVDGRPDPSRDPLADAARRIREYGTDDWAPLKPFGARR